MRSFLNRFLGAITGVILLCQFAPEAQAVFLSDLIAGTPATLSSTSAAPQPTPFYTVIGSNWSYTATGNMPAATGVNVTATPDLVGRAGFEFQGAFHDNPGSGTSDALILYQVALSPADIRAGKVFTDVHLESDVTVVGGSTTNNGSISIVETVRDVNGNLLGTLTNFDIWTATGQLLKGSDTLFLDPAKQYTVLNISKDILASSDTGNAVPQVSHIDQSYSVPEPSSLALITLGASVVLGGAMRRKMLRTSNQEAMTS
jgi:hypothetical protein